MTLVAQGLFKVPVSFLRTLGTMCSDEPIYSRP